MPVYSVLISETIERWIQLNAPSVHAAEYAATTIAAGIKTPEPPRVPGQTAIRTTVTPIYRSIKRIDGTIEHAAQHEDDGA